MEESTLNRSWIMHRAWYYLRLHHGRLTPFIKSRALMDAWADMKAKMQGLRLVDELTDRERQLANLEAKDITTPEDRDRIEALRTAIAQEKAEPALAAKRELIAARPCVVTFTKSDGTERTMRVEPGRLVPKGDAASKAARRAVKTRKARHPHLMPVWDADKGSPRSINLATVSRITVDGTVHRYA